MYPWIRVLAASANARRLPPLPIDGTHVQHTRCWPWDIDAFMELNNGRSMTLMDIGRMPLGVRTGLWPAIRARGWGLTMAGACITYRRRVRPFAPLEIRSRAIGRDARFLYIEQLSLTRGVPAHQAVYRAAVVGPSGIVPSQQVAEAMGAPDWNPELPPWVAAWIAAEAMRPWPPQPEVA